MKELFSLIINFFKFVFEALSNYKTLKKENEELKEQIIELNSQLTRERAWAIYWIMSYGVSLGVYIRNSIGRNSTYCNIFAYDAFDLMCNVVWNVKVQVGESLKIPFAMGNEIKGCDYDITPIMPDRNYNKILSAPIPEVYKNALKAAEKGEIRLLTPEIAQHKANKYGIIFMIIHPGLSEKKIGHVAVVIPYFVFDEERKKWIIKSYNPEEGPYTANAGWTNGIMPFSKGFGGYLDPDTLEPKPGAKCISKPAIIIEFKDRKTGKFLTEEKQVL